jgi:hypothetical protein
MVTNDEVPIELAFNNTDACSCCELCKRWCEPEVGIWPFIDGNMGKIVCEICAADRAGLPVRAYVAALREETRIHEKERQKKKLDALGPMDDFATVAIVQFSTLSWIHVELLQGGEALAGSETAAEMFEKALYLFTRRWLHKDLNGDRKRVTVTRKEVEPYRARRAA